MPDAIVLARIEATVPAEVRSEWMPRLLQMVDPDAGVSRLDWLRAGPVSKRPQGLADHIAKVSFLKTLGADRLALGLSLAGLRHYARPMQYRKPAAVPLMRAPRRTLELACFLRLQLLRLTDSGLDLLDHRIADLWRGARDRVEDRQDHQLRRYRRLVQDLHALLAEEALAAEALRGRLKELILPFPPDTALTKAAAIRRELSGDAAHSPPDDVWVIRAEKTSNAAVCPRCKVVSPTRHSSYRRRFWDLPIQGRPVRITLTVGL